jgi:molecular chaperone HtpG
VNANHPLASALLNEADEAKRTSMAKRAANLARLSQGLLEGEELTAFIAEGFAQLEQA